MLPLETPGGNLGFFGGQTYKSLGNIPNGWTNWHQIWYMSATSSGNGHRIETMRDFQTWLITQVTAARGAACQFPSELPGCSVYNSQAA